MTECQKNRVQTKKKRWKLMGIVSFIIILCVIIFGSKYLGRQAGEQDAMQTIKKESIAQNVPTTAIKDTAHQNMWPIPNNIETSGIGESSTGSSLSKRDSRFALVKLPLGVTIEVPKNWRILDGEINTTIETAGESILNLAGIELPRGKKINLFRANSNPPTTYAGIAINATDSDISPTELLATSENEIHEQGAIFHQMLDKSLSTQNLRVIRFGGIRKEIVDGYPSLVIDYVRSGSQGPVVVQMTRLFINDKEISLNLSYRQSEDNIWKPIIDYMRSTFRVYNK